MGQVNEIIRMVSSSLWDFPMLVLFGRDASVLYIPAWVYPEKAAGGAETEYCRRERRAEGRNITFSLCGSFDGAGSNDRNRKHHRHFSSYCGRRAGSGILVLGKRIFWNGDLLCRESALRKISVEKG